MERSSAGVRLLVTDVITVAVGEYGLSLQSAGGAYGATIARGDSSAEQYRTALARIADAINKHLDATAPKPEPIKVGDRVSVIGFSFKGRVREIDDKRRSALVTFDGGRWNWCVLANVTKVPS